MPAQRAYSEHDIARVVCTNNLKHELVDDFGKCVGPASNIWKRLQELYGNPRVSAKYLYTIFNSNIHNIRELSGVKLFQSVAIKNNDEHETGVLDCSSYNGSDDTLIAASSSLDSTEISFCITFEYSDWKDLVEHRIYNRSDGHGKTRKVQRLKADLYTTLLRKTFYKFTRLPCNLNFDFNKINPEGNNYWKIVGHCSTCSSVLTCVSDSMPYEYCPLILNCTYRGNYDCCNPAKKARLIGMEKDCMLNRLTIHKEAPSHIRCDMANEYMEYGEKEPSFIPTNNALRVLKYKHNLKDRIHTDEIQSLKLLQSQIEFKNSIHFIASSPFILHYYSTLQINLYRESFKQNKHVRISIDATGDVIKTPLRTDCPHTKRPIFLYQIAVNDDKFGIFAGGQMLSEKHDNVTISYFLSSWKAVHGKNPSIVIVDQSLALIYACVKSFTQHTSLKLYLDNCSDVITGRKADVQLPMCQIRLDINHTMHTIAGWAEIKNSSRRFKEFYLYSMALVIKSTNFADIQVLLGYIFTVGLSEDDGDRTACKTAKQYLKRRISTHEIPDADLIQEINNKSKIPDEYNNISIEEHINEEDSSNFFHIIQEIYKTSHPTLPEGNDGENLQYCPALSKRILNFCKLLPLWSAVMIESFGFGNIHESSTSAVESLFNHLKNRTFKAGDLPARLPDFVKHHLIDINGAMKLAASKLSENNDKKESKYILDTENITLTPELIEQEDHFDTEMINHTPETIEQEDWPTETKNIHNPEQIHHENWRGQNSQNLLHRKAVSRKTYSKPNPSIMHCNENSKKQCRIIGLIKHGSTLTLQAVRINKQRFIFNNTCPFDSIFHLFSCACCDSDMYLQYVSSKGNQLFDMIITALRVGINTGTYVERGIILQNNYSEHTTNVGTIFHIDCRDMMDNAVEKFFISEPSIICNEKCPNCNKSIRDHIVIPLIIMDLTEIEDRVNSYIADKMKCHFCKKLMDITINKHVIVASTIVEHHQLSTLPKAISIKKSQYLLRGLIHCIEPRNVRGLAHFVTYNYRQHSDRWEKYDDMDSSVKSLNPNALKLGELNPKIILYTL